MGRASNACTCRGSCGVAVMGDLPPVLSWGMPPVLDVAHDVVVRALIASSSGEGSRGALHAVHCPWGGGGMCG